MTRATPDISAADDAVEIVSGRGDLPWTQIHDWIALSGVGPASVGAYIVLKMHLNRQTGQLNPGTVRLAKLLQLPRADKVAALIRPLVEIGAVEVVAYGMPRRNRYIVHSLPPKGYEGPLSLAQWANRHEPEITKERERHARKAERARNRRSTPVPPDSGVLGEDTPVTPNSGVQVTPDSGVHVTPNSGVEPDVAEPDVAEPPPPPFRDEPTPAAVVARDEEEEDERRDTTDLTETARDVLRRATTGLPPARFPNRDQARRLVALAVDALRAGWCPDDLARRIGEGDLSKVDSVYAVLQHRFGQLGDPPARRVPAQLSGTDKPHTMSADTSERGWRDAPVLATSASDQAREFARQLAGRSRGRLDLLPTAKAGGFPPSRVGFPGSQPVAQAVSRRV